MEWFKAKHDPVISLELFEKCQEIRNQKARHHKPTIKVNSYLLRGIIFCAKCVANKFSQIHDEDYGKMIAFPTTNHLYYRCRARDVGRNCSQRSVEIGEAEAQVIKLLLKMALPEEPRLQLIQTVAHHFDIQIFDDRINEMKAIIQRMDFRWDHGLIANQSQYLRERLKLQQELEQLTPLNSDPLEKATDLVDNFALHWRNTGEDRKQQEELIHFLVERVWVNDKKVIAVLIKPDYMIRMG